MTYFAMLFYVIVIYYRP